MKIAAANLSMQAQHVATVRQETRESMRAWVGRERPDFEGHRQHPAAAQVRISEAGKQRQSAEAQAIQESTETVENDPMLLMIRRMVELLTGHTVRVFNADALRRDELAPEISAPEPSQATAAQRSDQGDSTPSAGFGVEYDYHAVREETEATSFAAQGTVLTADGRQIDFQLSLSMTRGYREETNISLRAGDARRKDPLVINFDGNAAQLTDQRFQFDLDADGTKDSLALLASGSGYLALDKNANGVIDSGTELFGPATGSGFAELAQYDQDGNGWIDENDAIFAHLRVWTPDAQSAGTVTTLLEQQVGALFLGELATPFALRGSQNSDLGAVRSTGLYLTESGIAGTLQEIDLTV